MINIHSFLPKKDSEENKRKISKINYIVWNICIAMVAIMVVICTGNAYSTGAYAAEYYPNDNEDTIEEEESDIQVVPSSPYIQVVKEEYLFAISTKLPAQVRMIDTESAVMMSGGDWAKLAIQEAQILQYEKEEEKKMEERKAKIEAEKKAEEERKRKEVAKREKEEKEKAEREKAKKEKEEKERKERKEREALEAEKARKAEQAKYAIQISQEDKLVLQRIVEAEATGQSVEGKLLVANVILNRVKSSTFPNTVQGVVFQKGQFSPIRDGRYYSVSVSQTTKDAVEQALMGEDRSYGALYFMARERSTQSNIRWFDNNLTLVCAYGGHEFFR